MRQVSCDPVWSQLGFWPGTLTQFRLTNEGMDVQNCSHSNFIVNRVFIIFLLKKLLPIKFFPILANSHLAFVFLFIAESVPQGPS